MNTSTGVPELRIESLTKTITRHGRTVEALSDFSYTTTRRGEFISVIGPSGCGKSTLLRILAGVLEPTSGVVAVGARTPRELRRQRQIGYVSGQPGLSPWLTVEAHLQRAVKHVGYRDDGLVSEVMDAFELWDVHDARAFRLSREMRHRAALAAQMIIEPELLLLDDPYADLEGAVRRRLVFELEDVWHARECPTVLATRSVSDAVLLSDTVLVMPEGPAAIVEAVTIGLPRPRLPETLALPEFRDLCARVTDALSGGRTHADAAGVGRPLSWC